MPKKDKVSIPKAKSMRDAKKSTEPRIEVMEREPDGMLMCTMCGKYKTTKGTRAAYIRSNSVVYKGTGGYIPVCKKCIEELYIAYRDALGSRKEAVRRLCMKFDIYWNESIYESAIDKHGANESSFKMTEYIKQSNLFQWRGKTFDTTLDEERRMVNATIDLSDVKKIQDDGQLEVTDQQIRTWGSGFDPLFYQELDNKYAYWVEDLDVESMDKATESLIRQICIQEVTLSRDAAAGRSIDKTARVIDSLLGSLNLKPVQKKEQELATQESTNEIDLETEMTPFGQWIRKIEDDRPIPEPEDKLKDVDNLRTYLQTWFVGGLCSMMHLPNRFSALYDEAMREYTVEKPEYENDDEDSSLDELFELAEEEGKRLQEDEDGWEEL